jgi:hypothetical protein
MTPHRNLRRGSAEASPRDLAVADLLQQLAPLNTAIATALAPLGAVATASYFTMDTCKQ